MRRELVVLLVAGLVVSGGYAIGFGTSDAHGDTVDEPDEPDGTLEIHHVDVGQADATLVLTPGGETILIDSGDWRDDGERVVEYLESQGVDRIDHLIATHAHADHIGGHAAVIEHFEEHGDGVDAAYDSGVVHTSQTYENYLDAVEEYDVTLFEVREGDDLLPENASVEATAVNPPAERSERTDDLHYNSIAITLEYGQFTYLTTGDAERHAEQRLVEDWGQQLDADAYQAGHHGSSSSSTDPFLDVVQPRIAIVSSALDSQYGHPHDEVLEAFADRDVETYWTGVHGTVVLETDGETVSVTTERSGSTDPLELLEEKHAAGDDDVERETIATDAPSIAAPTIGASTTAQPPTGTTTHAHP